MIIKNLSADTKYLLGGVEVDAKITIPHATTDGVVDRLTNSITFFIHPDKVSDKILYSIILNPKMELSSENVETKIDQITRDDAISYLIKHNNNVENISDCFTKLFFIDENGKGDYVTDFSPFLEYMSEDLECALINGQSLTRLQETEIEQYIIEKEYSRPTVDEVLGELACKWNSLTVNQQNELCNILAGDN